LNAIICVHQNSVLPVTIVLIFNAKSVGQTGISDAWAQGCCPRGEGHGSQDLTLQTKPKRSPWRICRSHPSHGASACL